MDRDFNKLFDSYEEIKCSDSQFRLVIYFMRSICDDSDKPLEIMSYPQAMLTKKDEILNRVDESRKIRFGEFTALLSIRDGQEIYFLRNCFPSIWKVSTVIDVLEKERIGIKEETDAIISCLRQYSANRKLVMDSIIKRFVLVNTHSYVDVTTHSKIPPNVFAITTCKLNDFTANVTNDKIIRHCKRMLSSTLESSSIKVVKVGNIVQHFITMRKEGIIFPRLKMSCRGANSIRVRPPGSIMTLQHFFGFPLQYPNTYEGITEFRWDDATGIIIVEDISHKILTPKRPKNESTDVQKLIIACERTELQKHEPNIQHCRLKLTIKPEYWQKRNHSFGEEKSNLLQLLPNQRHSVQRDMLDDITESQFNDEFETLQQERIDYFTSIEATQEQIDSFKGGIEINDLEEIRQLILNWEKTRKKFIEDSKEIGIFISENPSLNKHPVKILYNNIILLNALLKQQIKLKIESLKKNVNITATDDKLLGVDLQIKQSKWNTISSEELLKKIHEINGDTRTVVAFSGCRKELDSGIKSKNISVTGLPCILKKEAFSLFGPDSDDEAFETVGEAVVVDDNVVTIAGVGDTVNVKLVNDDSGVIYKKKRELVRFHIPNCSEFTENVDGKWTLTCSTADDDGGYSSDNDDGRKIDAGGAKRRHMKKKYKYNKKTNKKNSRCRKGKSNKRTSKNNKIINSKFYRKL
jgi:hypothetical protein